ncbi:low temperature requirement protein A [Candidatus Uabimicrobium amorphum]|uniref:Membrane protein n=1 Tax=Uabimicrobium amorphum TaxID=2596890 RepID=A0A5S9IMZ9_UABAM|nr:low temperature requirement protein A [Candidatus Uabimicrobium amorphum]BBM84322.1 membrane protein [Candidatus Uabimicrobium amorphum]
MNEKTKRYPWFKDVRVRTSEEPHRQSTWLELFLDLCFVICVGALARTLLKDHSPSGIWVYLALFVPIWWAWNQFTWYCSHFDNDDVPYRVSVLFVAMTIVALSTTIENIPNGFSNAFVCLYIILQAFLFGLWLRVLLHNDELKTFSLRFVLGTATAGAVWGISLFFPSTTRYVVWGVALLIQILTPIWAWSTVSYNFAVHDGHIGERYGLFTIIVLGESLLAVASALSGVLNIDVILTALCGFITAACIWWIYFDFDYSSMLETGLSTFVWGYGHFFIFASIAAVGVGIQCILNEILKGATNKDILGIVLFSGSICVYLLALIAIQWTVQKKWKDPILRVRLAAAFIVLVIGYISTFLTAKMGVFFITLVMLIVAAHDSYQWGVRHIHQIEKNSRGTSS